MSNNEIKLNGIWNPFGGHLASPIILLCSLKWDPWLGSWLYNLDAIDPSLKPYFLLINSWDDCNAYITDGIGYAHVDLDIDEQSICVFNRNDQLNKCMVMELIANEIYSRKLI